MQYRPPNVNEFSKHVGSVSDSLGRLSAASECMAIVKKLDNVQLFNNSQLDNDVLKFDTAFAENTLTKMDLGNRAVIPPHSAPERLIHFPAYKIDINDCTLDGKHTLHATLYTTWQI